FQIGRTELDGKLKPEGKFTGVRAVLKGSGINGVFEGVLKLNLKNLPESSVEGKFSGELFGRKTEENINLKLKNIYGESR
ncbi:MAG: hypothetical protein GXN94_02155, partial [Aquificae bacterium]|nr:hypothetical protein [Aquificota bacterium]